MFHWRCNQRDVWHGCFHADFDGYCTARSRRPFKTKEAAQKAADRHLTVCAFKGRNMDGGVWVYEVTVRKTRKTKAT